MSQRQPNHRKPKPKPRKARTRPLESQMSLSDESQKPKRPKKANLPKKQRKKKFQDEEEMQSDKQDISQEGSYKESDLNNLNPNSQFGQNKGFRDQIMKPLVRQKPDQNEMVNDGTKEQSGEQFQFVLGPPVQGDQAGSQPQEEKQGQINQFGQNPEIKIIDGKIVVVSENKTTFVNLDTFDDIESQREDVVIKQQEYNFGSETEYSDDDTKQTLFLNGISKIIIQKEDKIKSGIRKRKNIEADQEEVDKTQIKNRLFQWMRTEKDEQHFLKKIEYVNSLNKLFQGETKEEKSALKRVRRNQLDQEHMLLSEMFDKRQIPRSMLNDNLQERLGKNARRKERKRNARYKLQMVQRKLIITTQKYYQNAEWKLQYFFKKYQPQDIYKVTLWPTLAKRMVLNCRIYLERFFNTLLLLIQTREQIKNNPIELEYDKKYIADLEELGLNPNKNLVTQYQRAKNKADLQFKEYMETLFIIFGTDILTGKDDTLDNQAQAKIDQFNMIRQAQAAASQITQVLKSNRTRELQRASLLFYCKKLLKAFKLKQQKKKGIGRKKKELIFLPKNMNVTGLNNVKNQHLLKRKKIQKIQENMLAQLRITGKIWQFSKKPRYEYAVYLKLKKRCQITKVKILRTPKFNFNIKSLEPEDIERFCELTNQFKRICLPSFYFSQTKRNHQVFNMFVGKIEAENELSSHAVCRSGDLIIRKHNDQMLTKSESTRFHEQLYYLTQNLYGITTERINRHIERIWHYSHIKEHQDLKIFTVNLYNERKDYFENRQMIMLDSVCVHNRFKDIPNLLLHFYNRYPQQITNPYSTGYQYLKTKPNKKIQDVDLKNLSLNSEEKDLEEIENIEFKKKTKKLHELEIEQIFCTMATQLYKKNEGKSIEEFQKKWRNQWRQRKELNKNSIKNEEKIKQLENHWKRQFFQYYCDMVVLNDVNEIEVLELLLRNDNPVINVNQKLSDQQQKFEDRLFDYLDKIYFKKISYKQSLRSQAPIPRVVNNMDLQSDTTVISLDSDIIWQQNFSHSNIQILPISSYGICTNYINYAIQKMDYHYDSFFFQSQIQEKAIDRNKISTIKSKIRDDIIQRKTYYMNQMKFSRQIIERMKQKTQRIRIDSLIMYDYGRLQQNPDWRPISQGYQLPSLQNQLEENQFSLQQEISYKIQKNIDENQKENIIDALINKRKYQNYHSRNKNVEEDEKSIQFFKIDDSNLDSWEKRKQMKLQIKHAEITYQKAAHQLQNIINPIKPIYSMFPCQEIKGLEQQLDKYQKEEETVEPEPEVNIFIENVRKLSQKQDPQVIIPPPFNLSQVDTQNPLINEDNYYYNNQKRRVMEIRHQIQIVYCLYAKQYTINQYRFSCRGCREIKKIIRDIYYLTEGYWMGNHMDNRNIKEQLKKMIEWNPLDVWPNFQMNQMEQQYDETLVKQYKFKENNELIVVAVNANANANANANTNTNTNTNVNVQQKEEEDGDDDDDDEILKLDSSLTTRKYTHTSIDKEINEEFERKYLYKRLETKLIRDNNRIQIQRQGFGTNVIYEQSEQEQDIRNQQVTYDLDVERIETCQKMFHEDTVEPQVMQYIRFIQEKQIESQYKQFDKYTEEGQVKSQQQQSTFKRNFIKVPREYFSTLRPELKQQLELIYQQRNLQDLSFQFITMDREHNEECNRGLINSQVIVQNKKLNQQIIQKDFFKNVTRQTKVRVLMNVCKLMILWQRQFWHKTNKLKTQFVVKQKDKPEEWFQERVGYVLQAYSKVYTHSMPVKTEIRLKLLQKFAEQLISQIKNMKPLLDFNIVRQVEGEIYYQKNIENLIKNADFINIRMGEAVDLIYEEKLVNPTKFNQKKLFGRICMSYELFFRKGRRNRIEYKKTKAYFGALKMLCKRPELMKKMSKNTKKQWIKAIQKRNRFLKKRQVLFIRAFFRILRMKVSKLKFSKSSDLVLPYIPLRNKHLTRKTVEGRLRDIMSDVKQQQKVLNKKKKKKKSKYTPLKLQKMIPQTNRLKDDIKDQQNKRIIESIKKKSDKNEFKYKFDQEDNYKIEQDKSLRDSFERENNVDNKQYIIDQEDSINSQQQDQKKYQSFSFGNQQQQQFYPNQMIPQENIIPYQNFQNNHNYDNQFQSYQIVSGDQNPVPSIPNDSSRGQIVPDPRKPKNTRNKSKDRTFNMRDIRREVRIDEQLQDFKRRHNLNDKEFKKLKTKWANRDKKKGKYKKTSYQDVGIMDNDLQLPYQQLKMRQEIYEAERRITQNYQQTWTQDIYIPPHPGKQQQSEKQYIDVSKMPFYFQLPIEEDNPFAPGLHTLFNTMFEGGPTHYIRNIEFVKNFMQNLNVETMQNILNGNQLQEGDPNRFKEKAQEAVNWALTELTRNCQQNPDIFEEYQRNSERKINEERQHYDNNVFDYDNGEIQDNVEINTNEYTGSWKEIITIPEQKQKENRKIRGSYRNRKMPDYQKSTQKDKERWRQRQLKQLRKQKKIQIEIDYWDKRLQLQKRYPSYEAYLLSLSEIYRWDIYHINRTTILPSLQSILAKNIRFIPQTFEIIIDPRLIRKSVYTEFMTQYLEYKNGRMKRSALKIKSHSDYNLNKQIYEVRFQQHIQLSLKHPTGQQLRDLIKICVQMGGARNVEQIFQICSNSCFNRIFVSQVLSQYGIANPQRFKVYFGNDENVWLIDLDNQMLNRRRIQFETYFTTVDKMRQVWRYKLERMDKISRYIGTTKCNTIIKNWMNVIWESNLKWEYFIQYFESTFGCNYFEPHLKAYINQAQRIETKTRLKIKSQYPHLQNMNFNNENTISVIPHQLLLSKKDYESIQSSIPMKLWMMLPNDEKGVEQLQQRANINQNRYVKDWAILRRQADRKKLLRENKKWKKGTKKEKVEKNQDHRVVR